VQHCTDDLFHGLPIELQLAGVVEAGQLQRVFGEGDQVVRFA
jgi:hypothetical protein